jgi:hypothetical protein
MEAEKFGQRNEEATGLQQQPAESQSVTTFEIGQEVEMME